MNQVILSMEFAAAILTLLYILQLLLEARRGQQPSESLISFGRLSFFGQGMDVNSVYRKRSLRNQQIVDRSR